MGGCRSRLPNEFVVRAEVAKLVILIEESDGDDEGHGTSAEVLHVTPDQIRHVEASATGGRRGIEAGRRRSEFRLLVGERIASERERVADG